MKKITLLALALIYSSFMFSQEEEESKNKFSFNGSVDTYFKRNISAPSQALTDANGDPYFVTPATAFANRNGFGLGMANIVVGYEGEKVGFVADLGFGPRAEDAVFLSVGSSNIVNQLYMFWNVSDNVKLTIGNFNTFLGYEVISPIGNFNYSTSYMFSYGPFSHTGVKADISLGDLSLMFAVMNPTDYTEINIDDSYTFGGQVGYKGQFLNVLYGDQLDGVATFQIDFTGGLDIDDSLFVGLNATYNDTNNTSFYGVALYPQYKITEAFTLGVMEGRHCFEHLTVEENLLTGAYTRSNAKEVKLDLERVYNYFPRLRDRRSSQAGYTSGGEQQMIAIGRALMAKPTMILLDEPSMGLAPQLVKQIFEIVKDINKKEGVTILLAEQNTNIALQYAEYAYILENGRVVMEGSAESMRDNEDVKEFYLGISGEGRQSFKDVKQYRRRKRWL